MNPLPAVTAKQVARALERGGWALLRQTGSHMHYRHPTRGGLTTVPLHSGKTLPPWLLQSILKQSDLTADELRMLMG